MSGNSGHAAGEALLRFKDGFWDAGKGRLEATYRLLGGSSADHGTTVVEELRVGDLDVIGLLRMYPGAQAELEISSR